MEMGSDHTKSSALSKGNRPLLGRHRRHLSNTAVLKQWMCSLIAGQMQQKGWSYWDNLTVGDIASQELLTPALAASSEEDQTYFVAVASDNSFDDLIDLFSASFAITESTPVITDQGDEV